MLTTNEKLRYSRQIMMKNIGDNGQVALSNARVLIVGLGGLGNPASMYLAAAGIGTLYLADGDNIEVTNLQRQVLFTPDDINKNKAEITAEKLLQQNPEITVEVIDEMLDEELCQYYVNQVDVVLDCTDNIKTRYLINKTCVTEKTPLIIGAATGFDGQQLTVIPSDEDSACYQCLFPASEKAPTQNCQTIGIVGPVLAIIAGMQALQTIKLLTGNKVQTNQLNLFDGLSNQWLQFNLKKQKNCPICNK